MYIIDFFKRTVRVSNIPIIIYLVLNILIIVGVTYLFLGDFLISIVVGLGIYIVSLMITLSPLGEWILRMQTGCKKLARREHKEYLLPLFEEVYQKARKEDPTISPDVQIFINNSSAMNAFATGRKTICVNKGLLNLPPDEIRGILGHEFGHLAHKDTDLILLISVGNFFVTLFILMMRLVILAFNGLFFLLGVFSRDWFAAMLSALLHILEMALISGISWLWTQLGVLLCMKSSRSNEYLADEFSYKLGYGEDLCRALDAIDSGEGAEGLFATLVSTHPDTDSRIGHLQELEDLGIKVLTFDIPGQKYESNEIKTSVEAGDNRLIEPVEAKVVGKIAELECLSGEFAGMKFPIVADEQIIIGRDPLQANIILNNPHVSRKHCIIRYFESNDEFYVTDYSSYGTFLKDDKRIDKGKCIDVPSGTIIYLGDKKEAFLLVSRYEQD